MTFSLVARDTASGAFGIVISSSSPAVAARCAHARAGVGVVACLLVDGKLFHAEPNRVLFAAPRWCT